MAGILPHEGKCGPCFLCGKDSVRYTHAEKMNKAVLAFVSSIEGTHISNACICHACYKHAARNVDKENYIPRWTTKPSTREQCGVVSCVEHVYRHTTIASTRDIELILGEKVVSSHDAPVSTSLCKHHYTSAYTALHAPKPCESCNSKPKWGEQHRRHCPEPNVINAYFTTISGERSTLEICSRICNVCYKLFKNILAQIQRTRLVMGQMMAESVINLEETLALISKQIDAQRESREDFYEGIFCSTAMNIARTLSRHEAMLLPSVYKRFFEATIAEGGKLGISRDEVPSVRWFISRLYHYFGDAIVFECKHCRFGTLMYHKDCDLLKALSYAVGQQKEALPCAVEGSNSVPAIEKQVHTVALHLNSRLHEESKKLVSKYRDPDSYSNLNISTLLKEVDPALLLFIRQLTCTGKQRRQKLVYCTVDEADSKEIRHFYALCVLLFNTNSACSAPLHVMLTEAILCHGGSLELVRIMNKVGAVASVDTSSRLATQVVQIRLYKGIKPSIVPGMITLLSIDNLDILMPNAVVSSLDATRSWHGTSAQCVQPLPVTGILSAEEIASDQPDSQLENSPVYHSKRRRRTLSEGSPHTRTPLQYELANDNLEYKYSNEKPTIKDFLLNDCEKATLLQLKLDMHLGMLLKYFNRQRESDKAHLPLITPLVHCLRKQSAESECSNVVYFDVLSEKADCKPTILHIIGKVHQTFVSELNQKWVLAIGDAKVYDILQALKTEYGDNLKWLIPLPGDWHVLLNYHKALMKPYADAGFMNLAKVSGYRSETLTSLRNGSNFRRNHLFLLQCFETLYHYYLNLFLEDKGGDTTEEMKQLIYPLLDKFSKISTESDLQEFRSTAKPILKDKVPLIMSQFTKYLDTIIEQHETHKFWHGFLFEDCMPYLSLFISTRHRNWDMRVASMKQLVATYTAFDHQIYGTLIPQHLLDLRTLPDCILAHLRRGAFAIRLSSSDWCGVALDECHEMKINKDSKMAVIRPSEERMSHLSNYLQFRAGCIHNLKSQLFPEKTRNCFIPSSRDRASEENIKSMLRALQSQGMHDKIKGLCTLLQHKHASPEQRHDLLNFRKIGQDVFENYVRYKLLKEPSTEAPLRKKRLLTFTIRETHKKRVKQVEKERKISQRFLKRQLAWLEENNISPSKVSNLFGPISTLPRALIDKCGLPYKSCKSSATKCLVKRYQEVLLTSVPWEPTSVLLEGMFIIQTAPFPGMNKMEEYAKLLFIRYIKPHFCAGVVDVHVVFDNPGGLLESPKELEQNRRDTANNALLADHKCEAFHSTSQIPQKWRATLACRTCKAALTCYLAHEFLRLAPSYMMEKLEQEFVTNIKNHAYSSSMEEIIERPSLYTNTDEADMRIWLHCAHSTSNSVLIFSPDTDVYHVGLAMAQILSHKRIIVQLSKSLIDSPRLIDLNALLDALARDPDLCEINQSQRPQVLQTLYACTGCDYVSYFAGIGKPTFYSTFFQYAGFIAGGTQPGSLGDISPDLGDPSLFSFLRLIGCVYFKLHSSAFEHPTPASLFNSIVGKSDIDTLAEWLNIIRKKVWLRADREAQNVPSTDALRLHWYRCIWVLGLWHSATDNEIELPALTDYGWKRDGGRLEVVWDTTENVEEIQQRLDFVLKGCKCKTGCNTKRCKCNKGNMRCGPGCQCIGCTNAVVAATAAAEEDDIEVEGYDDDSTDGSEEDTEEECEGQDDQDPDLNNMLETIFGSDSEDEQGQ